MSSGEPQQAGAGDLCLCGWRVRSEIPLPSLPTWTFGEDAPVDISITFGAVLPDDAVVVSDPISLTPDGAALVDVARLGRFRVADGRMVVADMLASHIAGAVQTAILSPVLSLLCYQRGLVPLHASAVMIDGRAVALGGRHGAGKSTLAASLARRGHVLLSDDISPYRVREQGTLLLPSSRHSRLRPDAVRAFGEDRQILVNAAAVGPPKFHVPMPVATAIAEVPLHGLVYLIRDDDEDGPEAPRLLAGVERLQAIGRCVYRRELAGRYAKEGQFTSGSPLPGVRIYEFRRRRSLGTIDQACDEIEAIAASDQH